MPTSFRERMVRQSVNNLKHCSPGARTALREALVNHVTVEGFRPQKNLTAPPAMLIRSAARDCVNDDALMGALLRGWVESQPELARAAREFFDGRPGAVVGEVDWEKGFPGAWTQDQMIEYCTEFTSSSSQFNEDDVCLMLCLQSGCLPVPCQSPQAEDDRTQGEQAMENIENTVAHGDPEQPRRLIWEDWIAALRSLDPDAAEWDAVEAFTDEVKALAASKLEARQTARKDLAEAVARLNCCEDAIEFFELSDIRQWQPDRLDLAQCKEACQLVNDLAGQLMAYMQRYGQPTNNFKEQREKVAQLDAMATCILETHERVSAFFAEPPVEGGDQPEPIEDSEAQAGPHADDIQPPAAAVKTSADEDQAPAEPLAVPVDSIENIGAAEAPVDEMAPPAETGGILDFSAQPETADAGVEMPAAAAPDFTGEAGGSAAEAQPPAGAELFHEVEETGEEPSAASNIMETGERAVLEEASQPEAAPEEKWAAGELAESSEGEATAGPSADQTTMAGEDESQQPEAQEPDVPPQPEPKPEPVIPTEPDADLEDEIVPPPPFKLPIRDLETNFSVEPQAPVPTPLPPPDPLLVQKVEAKLPLWISDPSTYPEAYLLLDWLSRRCGQTTTAFPPAAWIQVAYEIFGSPNDVKTTLDLAPLNSAAAQSVELEAARWMLLAGATLLRGEYDESLVQYQNWMAEEDLNIYIEVGEALQSYMRENRSSLDKAVELLKQPDNQPSAEDYFESARALYQGLTNPTRFGFTKGKNMMQTMREGLEWLGTAMDRRKGEDLAAIEKWIKDVNPNRQIIQWDRSSQPTRFPIDGWVKQDLVGELRDLRDALREWAALLKAPRVDSGESLKAIKALTLTVYREADRWTGEMGSLYEFYPTLTGFTNLLLERMLDLLKPAQDLISKEPTA